MAHEDTDVWLDWLVLRAIPDNTAGVEAKVVHFGGPSLHARALNLFLRTTVSPVITAWTLTHRFPWPYRLADHAGRFLPSVTTTTTERIEFTDFEGVLVRPHHVGRRVGVYLHGGALLVGGKHLHRSLVSRIATMAEMRMVVPDYRQLPRYSVDHSIADAVEAYGYALTLVDDSRDIILLGDSAGGFLSFMVALAARENNLPMPGGIVAMSPLIELEHRDRGIDVRPKGEVLFGPRALRAFTHTVRRLQHDHGGKWPLAGPTQSDLSGLPPTLIQTSSAEILHAEAMQIATMLAEAGVPVEVQIWDDVMHVFQAAAGVLPEATEAVEQIVVFAKRIGLSCDAAPGAGDVATARS